MGDKTIEVVLAICRFEMASVELEHHPVGGVEAQDMNVGLQLLGAGHEGFEHVGKLQRKPSGRWAALRRSHKELKRDTIEII